MRGADGGNRFRYRIIRVFSWHREAHRYKSRSSLPLQTSQKRIPGWMHIPSQNKRQSGDVPLRHLPPLLPSPSPGSAMAGSSLSPLPSDGTSIFALQELQPVATTQPLFFRIISPFIPLPLLTNIVIRNRVQPSLKTRYYKPGMYSPPLCIFLLKYE